MEGFPGGNIDVLHHSTGTVDGPGCQGASVEAILAEAVTLAGLYR
jgi:hypothetical protein